MTYTPALRSLGVALGVATIVATPRATPRLRRVGV